MLLKSALSMSANLENSAMATGLERPVFIPFLQKGNAKECLNFCTIVLISHASKVILKILHTWLQHYLNQEHPDVQAGLRKGRGSRGQIASTHWITEKARGLKKKSTSTSLMMLKPLTVWITKTCGKLLKTQEHQTTYLPPEKPVCRS